MQEDFANYKALKSENEQLRKQLQEMEQRAHHDALTNLPNRRFFLENLEHRISRCQRYGDVTALLFLDVDNLKMMNDARGHGAGDTVLVHLAQILMDSVRASDMVARIGGDEFALLLDNLDADQVDRKIERLIDRISKTKVDYEGRLLGMSVAIGYCFVGPKDSVSGLMSRADAAMYEAKRQAI